MGNACGHLTQGSHFFLMNQHGLGLFQLGQGLGQFPALSNVFPGQNRQLVIELKQLFLKCQIVALGWLSHQHQKIVQP